MPESSRLVPKRHIQSVSQPPLRHLSGEFWRSALTGERSIEYPPITTAQCHSEWVSRSLSRGFVISEYLALISSNVPEQVSPFRVWRKFPGVPLIYAARGSSSSVAAVEISAHCSACKYLVVRASGQAHSCPGDMALPGKYLVVRVCGPVYRLRSFLFPEAESTFQVTPYRDHRTKLTDLSDRYHPPRSVTNTDSTRVWGGT